MTEAMTEAGLRNAVSFLSRDALEEDSILHNYCAKPAGHRIPEAGKSYTWGMSPLPPGKAYPSGRELRHDLQNTKAHHCLYYRHALLPGAFKFYHGDLLMLNLTFLHPRTTPSRPGALLDHLAMPDAERLIKDIKPKIALLTHSAWVSGVPSPRW